MRVGQRLYLVGMGLLFATSALAVQKVTPVKDTNGTVFAGAEPNWSATVPAGTQLVFFGRYSSDLANESGLGLQVQFDNTKFTTVTVDQVFTKCMVAAPQTDVAGKVTFGWADTSIRRSAGVPTGAVGWTGTADPAAPGQPDGCLNPGNIVTTSAASGPPVNLFRIVATTAAGFTSGTSTITLLPTSFSKAAGQNAAAPVTQTLVVTGTAAPLCNLDVDNSGTRQAFVDGILIVRNMLGISGANLVAGVTIPGTITDPTLLHNAMAASNYDVDGSNTQQAFVDGIILVRLMLGIANANLLTGVTVPGPINTAAAIRTNVNTKCGTSF